MCCYRSLVFNFNYNSVTSVLRQLHWLPFANVFVLSWFGSCSSHFPA